MGSPRTHQGVTVHEETIRVYLSHRVHDLVGIPWKVWLTWLEWVGEVNDSHGTKI